MTEEGRVLKIDPEFRRLIFPYDQEEYAALERQILQCGCCEPVVAWYGHIIQGFERYDICMSHDIAFKVKHLHFHVREEIISIVCREELRNRYLPENQRRYLIGKRYNADIIIGAHNAAGTNQFKERMGRELSKGKNLYESSVGRTKERFAQDYHLSKCSVTRYSVYAQAIDHIASIRSETADQILAGEITASMEAVMACYDKTEDEVTQLLAAPGRSVNANRRVCAKADMIEGTTVKDMPVFDPDAEINSLALTIPSWISSIDRTRSAAKFPLLTAKGRRRLEQELYKLEQAAQMMLHSLKEVR